MVIEHKRLERYEMIPAGKLSRQQGNSEEAIANQGLEGVTFPEDVKQTGRQIAFGEISGDQETEETKKRYTLKKTSNEGEGS